MASAQVKPCWRALVLTILALSTSSNAVILGCSDVNCPLDQNHNPQCSIANSTASGIGLTSVNSALSTSQPLTWTLLVQEIKADQNMFERDFFLGTPPSLDLSSNSSSLKSACALFFDGIATKLRFPGSDREYDQGTCDDALNSTCVADLLTQGHDELDKIIKSNQNTSDEASVCNSLSDALRDHAPASCTAPADGKWGTLLARPLTGANASKPVNQGTCHPTNEPGYALTQVAANQIQSPSRNVNDLEPILLGITPIMIITHGGGSSDIENSLTCLKTVGSKPGNETAQHGNGAAANLAFSPPAFGLWTLIMAGVLFFSW